MIDETIKELKLTARLGKGGMGEVWAAKQQSIKTRVAIKHLLADISTDACFDDCLAQVKQYKVCLQQCDRAGRGLDSTCRK